MCIFSFLYKYIRVICIHKHIYMYVYITVYSKRRTLPPKKNNEKKKKQRSAIKCMKKTERYLART